jgi:monoamine oxidase
MSSEFDVVIVGAGAAGVGAARRLAGTSLSTLLIEASGRVGGRACTARRAIRVALLRGFIHNLSTVID